MDTFYDSNAAELGLCLDRPNFLMRRDIIQLIPSDIAIRITHPSADAQITGFQGLFVILNTKSEAEELRRLIVHYFNHSASLRGHLS